MTTLEAADLDALRQARDLLENRNLAARLASVIGGPIEGGLRRLPKSAGKVIATVSEKALSKCLQGALLTIQPKHDGFASSDRTHKWLSGASGAVGGFFGFAALPVELPASTTLIFRSICDIARAEGEDLRSREAQIEALFVFTLGGHGRTTDDGIDSSYFAARAALAAEMKAALAAAQKGGEEAGKQAVVKLVTAVARFFVPSVTHQAAAKAVPFISSALGAAVNVAFMDHFQSMAHGHFTLRRLKRKYSDEIVDAAYAALAADDAKARTGPPRLANAARTSSS